MVREHINNIPQRSGRSHKGDFGRVLIIAGSRGMTGAAFLCSMGALRAGSGLVYNVIPDQVEPVLEVKLTEVITVGVSSTTEGSLSALSEDKVLAKIQECDVVAAGPGLGRCPETVDLIRKLISKTQKPLVLDADGLNACGGETRLLSERKFPTVLTPHPGELSRLLGTDAQSIQGDRESIASTTAKRFGCIVVLKGHNTVVAGPAGELFVNRTGNSAMATAGTGDILTGMIASFIGQGIDIFSSCASAVYLHGLAGDISLREKGAFCTIASDILDALPEAFNKVGT